MAMLGIWVTAIKDKVRNASSALSATGASPSETTTSSLPSVRSLSNFAFSGAQALLGGSQAVLGGNAPACSNPQLSCHNTSVVENLCCFNAPGGQLLQTQFWDTKPATGPDDSWTIHGLWPDRCDGSYDANCDHSRVYRNISAILKAAGKTELFDYMSTYWKDYKGDDETFWQHEWSKHGTCVSTLEPHCYPDHKPTEEVVDYFQKAVDLFKELPSYEWLAAAGITPSTSQTYTTQEIQNALAQHRPGVTVTLGCKYGALNEIWYHYEVLGSVQTGKFVPSDPDGTKSTCPANGIRYLPKHRAGSPAPTHTITKLPPGPTHSSKPGVPFSGKGFLNVNVGGGPQMGCIISGGTWFSSGTCATFFAEAVSGGGGDDEDEEDAFTLTSSRGKCGVAKGVFTCGPSVRSATGFTSVGGLLAAGGNAAWSADKVAHGHAKQRVYAGSEHGTGLEIVWEGL